MDLVRLAIPRRTYTQSHIDYVIEVVERVAAPRRGAAGLPDRAEPPALRHFTARFEPLGVGPSLAYFGSGHSNGSQSNTILTLPSLSRRVNRLGGFASSNRQMVTFLRFLR